MLKLPLKFVLKLIVTSVQTPIGTHVLKLIVTHAHTPIGTRAQTRRWLFRKKSRHTWV